MECLRHRKKGENWWRFLMGPICANWNIVNLIRTSCCLSIGSWRLMNSNRRGIWKGQFEDSDESNGLLVRGGVHWWKSVCIVDDSACKDLVVQARVWSVCVISSIAHTLLRLVCFIAWHIFYCSYDMLSFLWELLLLFLWGVLFFYFLEVPTTEIEVCRYAGT